jgi:hypothetical protein
VLGAVVHLDCIDPSGPRVFVHAVFNLVLEGSHNRFRVVTRTTEPGGRAGSAQLLAKGQRRA